ncbi:MULTISPECIES: histidine phosphatase family protein [unclassified Streptomyces]|uniref:histidine phosphatase family protein n=1 Tax=unclassified Streptomyces TaxID=2593676 RepID=UPI000DB9848F|nr:MULTISPECIES: histidine phosphatase family protein [unclassified Streptomyces]MYT75511.1 histidine phosphatase family protein [Streptomyces sp. SID8367]RAJ86917.1 putative phosphoglycerate mutase [Streptomyces sp. PsTaAH-137]
MRLILIRHGQTPSNLKHLLDTAVPGPGLTPLGLEQAAALPEALAGEEIDALYVSTLLRTQLTAAPLAEARGLEPVVREGLRELIAGELEMRGDDEAAGIYMTTAFAWAAGDVERRMPGAENGTEALGRFDAVVAEAAGSGAGTVAMVSHGAAIRTWVAARATNIDVAHSASHPLSNTGVVVLDGSPETGWRCVLWEGEPLGPADPAPDADGPTGAAVTGVDS